LLNASMGWSACDGGIAVAIGIRFGNGVVVTREDSVHYDRISEFQRVVFPLIGEKRKISFLGEKSSCT
jgi:hypothetical protein